MCCEAPIKCPVEGDNTLMSSEKGKKKEKKNLISSWVESCLRCGTDVNMPICASFVVNKIVTGCAQCRRTLCTSA